MTFGSLAGGKLMKIGRRKAQFVNISIGLVGTAMTAILNTENILLGRFLFGFSSGLLCTTIPRYVEETVPVHLFDNIGPIFNVSQGTGTFFSYLLGELLPADTDAEALKATDRWRILYFYFPATIYIILLFCFIFTVRHDSVKFLVMNGKTAEKVQETKYALCLIYKHCDASNVDAYIRKIRSTCGSDSSELTIKEALTHPQYRRSTWVNVIYIIFHELTGIMVVIMYSN